MKDGVTDPFAQDEPNDGRDEPASQTDESDSPHKASDSEPAEPTKTETRETSNTGQYDRSDFPRILTRDTVKEDRDHVHQLFVYQDTHDMEKDARRELEDRLGDGIYKLDVREAIYRAGMENLDDAEATLREWGADI